MVTCENGIGSRSLSSSSRSKITGIREKIDSGYLREKAKNDYYKLLFLILKN